MKRFTLAASILALAACGGEKAPEAAPPAAAPVVAASAPMDSAAMKAMADSAAKAAPAAPAAPAAAKQAGPDPNKVYDIAAGTAPSAGPAKAKVTILHYLDYQ